MSSQEQATSGEVVASVRLSRAQHARLREIAEGEHRTISQQLRLLIDRHLDELDVPAPPELRKAA